MSSGLQRLCGEASGVYLLLFNKLSVSSREFSEFLLVSCFLRFNIIFPGDFVGSAGFHLIWGLQSLLSLRPVL